MHVAVWMLLGIFWACYGLAYLFGRLDETRTRRAHRSLLRLTSLTLVITSGWLYLQTRGSPLDAYALWILLGMAMCFIGDLFTGGLIPARSPYLVGIVVFSIGHLLYLVAMEQARAALGFAFGWLDWAIGLLLGLAFWWVAFSKTRSRLRIPALFYTQLILVMATSAVLLAVQVPHLWMVAVGAAFFSVSDALLGLRELRGHAWFLIHDVVWATYIVGQAFIVWSVYFA